MARRKKTTEEKQPAFAGKRIYPSEIVEAFKAKNLIPKQGDYFSGNNSCACGLGAYFMHKEGHTNNGLLNGYFDSNFGHSYRLGFVHGFDQQQKHGCKPEYLAGYEDGQASWNAVVEAGLSE